ncbi:hypothetical protein BG006_001492 [Podila minutissima]|uniref:Uncharacterized protein n=1 Tax=Podila minutissima TaxID=64525 RepID=A0A9P5SA95_9FUNG|nr:hypothetical protein BG006_001492 [Podila minutissima]
MSEGKLSFEKVILRPRGGPTTNDEGTVVMNVMIGTGDGAKLHRVQLDPRDNNDSSTEFADWVEQYGYSSADQRAKMEKCSYEASGVYHHTAYLKRDGPRGSVASFAYVSLSRFKEAGGAKRDFGNLPVKETARITTPDAMKQVSRAVTILQGMGGSKEQAGEIDNGEGPSTPRPKPIAKAKPVAKATRAKKAGSTVVIELDTDAGLESDGDGQDGLDNNVAEILRNMRSMEALPKSVQGFDSVLADIQDDDAGDAGGHESSALTTGGHKNVVVDESTQEAQDADAAKASSAGAQKKKKDKKEKKEKKVKDGKDKAPVLGDITTSAVNGATGGSHGTKHPSDLDSDATEKNAPQGKRGRGRPAKPKA